MDYFSGIYNDYGMDHYVVRSRGKQNSEYNHKLNMVASSDGGTEPFDDSKTGSYMTMVATGRKDKDLTTMCRSRRLKSLDRRS